MAILKHPIQKMGFTEIVGECVPFFKGRVQLPHELKSFADAFLDETCGSSRQLDYALACACSVVLKQNR